MTDGVVLLLGPRLFDRICITDM